MADDAVNLGMIAWVVLHLFILLRMASNAKRPERFTGFTVSNPGRMRIMAGCTVFRSKMTILLRIMAHGTFRNGVFSMINVAISAADNSFVTGAFCINQFYQFIMTA